MNKNVKTLNYDLYILLAEAVIVFLSACCLMYWLQFNSENPYFTAYDSYYHVKMSLLLGEQGILKEFPWLYFTTLKDHFVNHHFLFHLGLLPFIKIFGVILGPKIAQIITISVVFTFGYLLLKQLKIKGALIISLILILGMSGDFYFRMNMIRDMGLSLIFMLAGILMIFRNNLLAIFLLSFFYVWSYGAFMFLPIFAIIYFIAQFLSTGEVKWQIPTISLGGMLAGLIINPYFPANLDFLFTQIFQTGLGAQEYVGGEWKPYDTWYWVEINYFPLLLFFGGIILSLINGIKNNAKTIAIFVFALFFLVLQWKSKRFVEYSSFYLSFVGILLMKDFIEMKIEEFQQGNFLKNKQNIIYGLLVFMLINAFAVFSYSQINAGRASIKTSFSMSALMNIHEYLKNNAQKGDIVFTDDWDVFPRYFFANHHVNYIVGLDPELMNQYDGEPYAGEKGRLYKEFADISSGNDANNLERIKNIFQAKWVLVNEDHQKFLKNLRNNVELFEEVLISENDSQIDRYDKAQNDKYYLFKVR